MAIYKSNCICPNVCLKIIKNEHDIEKQDQLSTFSAVQKIYIFHGNIVTVKKIMHVHKNSCNWNLTFLTLTQFVKRN